MRGKGSASVGSREARGLLSGTAGVVAFSLTLVATRAAEPAFGALTVGAGRAVLAAGLAVALLRRRGLPLLPPDGRVATIVIAATVVVGFPLLTSWALADVPVAHAAVVVGLAPAATAGFAVVLAGERPAPPYWAALGVGLAAVLAFAVVQGAGRPRLADLLVLAAVVLVGLGYAEGGLLARRVDGAVVICWALLAALPVTVPLAAAGLAAHPPRHVTVGAAAGLGYVSVVSMFLGFVVWYRGLALGGVARVGRLQLAQPVLTLAWAALLLGEPLTPLGAGTAMIVLASVGLGRHGVHRGRRTGAGARRPSAGRRCRVLRGAHRGWGRVCPAGRQADMQEGFPGHDFDGSNPETRP
ncbi:DMT family transporter [Frankia gtarii]|uniref:DMT family transporter n=1 Tax=Frankia gtarii TaxID=2950102 RepID=UPI0021C23655|nr:DMT family transporter [Frankia gtarii]